METSQSHVLALNHILLFDILNIFTILNCKAPNLSLVSEDGNKKLESAIEDLRDGEPTIVITWCEFHNHDLISLSKWIEISPHLKSVGFHTCGFGGSVVVLEKSSRKKRLVFFPLLFCKKWQIFFYLKSRTTSPSANGWQTGVASFFFFFVILVREGRGSAVRWSRCREGSPSAPTSSCRGILST